MGHVASAVSVITTTVDGVPKGTTVSAFCSLSLDLAMVLVSLDRNSELLEAIRQTGVFGVNVLHRTQADLGLRFAKKGGDKFEGASWELANGPLHLPGANGWPARSIRSCRAATASYSSAT